MDKHAVTGIPSPAIDRLPLYLRALSQLVGDREVVTSSDLGDRLGIHPAQIRKDLRYLGQIGRQGQGYNVRKLADALRGALGLDREWRIALVGVGQLGRAILDYPEFSSGGFRIVEVFESDPSRIGCRVAGLTIRDSRCLGETLAKSPVDLAIVAVSTEDAQGVIDQLTRCQVKAILNYAPFTVHAPPGVNVKNMDPVLALQTMTFYLGEAGGNATKAADVPGEIHPDGIAKSALLERLSRKTRKELRHFCNAADDIDWPSDLARWAGWRAASGEYLRFQRDLGNREMRALMTALDLSLPLDAAAAREAVIAATKLYLMTDALRVEGRIKGGELHLDLTRCPLAERFANSKGPGLTVCACFARRTGWYEALGVNTKENLLMSRKRGDAICQVAVRMKTMESK